MNKENRMPTSFAKKAAETAIIRSKTPETVLNSNYDITKRKKNNKQAPNNQIDKVVESVVNATKRLSQQSNHSNSSNRKAENRVGPWRLGRTLGKGSTGRVRLAKHTITGQLAAIKIVPKNIIDLDFSENNNNSKKKRTKKSKVDENGLPYGIEREIIIMKLISHPNIMALYDVWENKNELYLVLEYVEGGELFDFLINNGKLNEADAIKYFRMIISGVSYCHKFNICHRDLKPENILLDKNGKIKIADFGMAALETQQKLLETSCGSPHYASPEIVAGKNYHGSPSDVWSCGVILFALLTGHLPFDDPNIRQLLMKVQTGKFHMPSNLSNDAKDLIWSMLRTNPNERIKIEHIFNHPLLLKYPDESIHTEIEDKLDHLDISRPVKNIDFDILNNLQTLWNGIPQSHIIKMLQNNHRNPEKMFYYLLENYKLTHSGESQLPDLKHSISKTTLRLNNSHSNSTDNSNNNSSRNSSKNSNQQLPRSTSTVITTIYDKDGQILKSESQEIKPLNTLKKKKHSNSNMKVVASTSFNKSISFQKIRRDTSASTLSIVNMSRNLSILPDTNHYLPRDRQSSLALNKNISKNVVKEKDETLSSSKPNTINPKDLPDLPDLHDYKYLVNSIFDPTYSDSDLSASKNSKHETIQKEKANKKPNKIENDIIILDIADASTDDPNDTSTTMNTTNTSSKLEFSNDELSANSTMTKLEKLRKDLGITNNSKNNSRNISGLKSIRSSSTRRLHSFLQDEYKNVKVNDFNTANTSINAFNTHRAQPSVTYSHKTDKSIDLSMSYSLHSAVEVKMMSPTEEELRNMNDGRIFEDANESRKNLHLINSDNIPTVHQNIIPNVNINDSRKADIRNSLLTVLTNEGNSNESKLNDNEPANSMYADAEESSHLNSTCQDTYDTEITGSLYTTLEEQPPAIGNVKRDKPFIEHGTDLRLSMKPVDNNNEEKRTYVESPLNQVSSPVAAHPFRTVVSEKSPVVEDDQFEKPKNVSTPVVKNSTNVAQSSSSKKSSNWIKKIFSAFNKKPHNTETSKSTNTEGNRSTNKKRNKTQRTSQFFNNISSFTFSKASYKGNTGSLFNSEYLIDSDVVTKSMLVARMREDSRTKMLKLIRQESSSSGITYVFEVSNLNTQFAVDIMEKVGSEYGFGGCYIKLVKLRGNKKSFDYWCTIINNIILELEKEE